MNSEAAVAAAHAAGYATEGMAGTINQGISYGYRKWGFVIYRCTYDNDALWNAFITMLKASVGFELRDYGQEDILGPHLQWTIIEDRATLDGASKETVRQRFLEWVAAHSVERDGEGIDNPNVILRLPRFRYCILVDGACLDAVRARYSSVQPAGYCLEGDVVLINAGPESTPPSLDSDEEDEEEQDDVYEEVEGCTAEDVGWMYVKAGFFCENYEELSWNGSHRETWRRFYSRPSPEGPSEVQGDHLLSIDLSLQSN